LSFQSLKFILDILSFEPDLSQINANSARNRATNFFLCQLLNK